jgi:hypothetical protein
MCQNCEDKIDHRHEGYVAAPIDITQLPFEILLQLYTDTTKAVAGQLLHKLAAIDKSEKDQDEKVKDIDDKMMVAAKLAFEQFNEQMKTNKWDKGTTLYTLLYATFNVANQLLKDISEMAKKNAKEDVSTSVPTGLPGKGKEHWN